MTTKYSSTGTWWRGYVTYSTSQTKMQTSISLSAIGIQATGWINYPFHVTVSATGKTSVRKPSSGSTRVTLSSSGDTKSLGSQSFTWDRGTSNATKTITATFYNDYNSEHYSISISLSVPARDTSTITYHGNASGVTNIPAKQTYYYHSSNVGKLRSDIPVRSGYTFLGWSKSSTATAASYQPGASWALSQEGDFKLYAVWKQSYVAPKISKAAAYRCDSSGTASDDGTYGRVTFTLTPGKYGGDSIKSIAVAWKLESDSAYSGSVAVTVPDTSSGAATCDSGAFSGSLAADSGYDVKITVTDSKASVTYYLYISAAFIYLDFSDKANTIGIGGPAADASPNSNGLTQVRTDVEIRGKVSRWAPGKVISSRYTGAGYITGSAKRISFMIPFPYIDLYSIKLTALSITVRQGGKYLLGDASSSYNALSQTSARMQPEGIDITINLSSAPSGAVNNDVIGIAATYTVEVTA